MKVPELEESLLRAARESLSPSSADRQRHEAALLARLQVPDASETALRAPMRSETRELVGTSGLWAKASPQLMRSRIELLSAGLAVGMAVGGAVGFILGRSGQAALERNGPTASVTDQRSEGAIGAEPQLRYEAAARDAHLDEAETPTATEPTEPTEPSQALDRAEEPGSQATLTTRRYRPVRARQPERAKPESSLAIELSMLQRARRALGADNGRLALGIVQELEERFPKGVLMEERRATRVLSLCLLGRTDEARRFGSEFLAQHGSSVYAERVRASCAVDGR